MCWNRNKISLQSSGLPAKKLLLLLLLLMRIKTNPHQQRHNHSALFPALQLPFYTLSPLLSKSCVHSNEKLLFSFFMFSNRLGFSQQSPAHPNPTGSFVTIVTQRCHLVVKLTYCTLAVAAFFLFSAQPLGNHITLLKKHYLNRKYVVLFLPVHVLSSGAFCKLSATAVTQQ